VIGLVRAFIWLRWRLLANGLTGSHRRDAVERLSRVLALLAPAFMIFFFALGSLAMTGMGSLAGYTLARGAAHPEGARATLVIVRLLLTGITAVLILIPLGRSLQSGLPGANRFLLLPVPRSLLHFVDVAAGLFDPWLIFIVPGLVALALAMAVSGDPLGGAVALAAGVALVAALTCLGGLVTFTIQWIMKERRRAEWAGMIFIIVLSSAGMIPALLAPAPGAGWTKVRLVLPPLWTTLPLPGEMYGWALRQVVRGHPAAALRGIAGLLCEAGLLFWLSSKVHAHLLVATSGSGGRRSGAMGAGREWRLPWLGPGATSVARAQFVTGLRTVRGRIGVFLNGPIVVLITILLHRFTRSELPGLAVTDGPSILGLGVLLSLLSLQPIMMNQFATDRSGLTTQLLAPVSDYEMLMGKATGCLMLVWTSSLLCLAASVAVSPGGPLTLWVTAVLCSLATTLFAAPVAALLSILFPRRADLNKVGGGGNAHGAAVLAGSLMTLLSALPGSVILLAGSWLETPGITAAIALAWAAVAAIVAWAALFVLGPVLAARRENLLLVAGGG
jgi:hypothetical protein